LLRSANRERAVLTWLLVRASTDSKLAIRASATCEIEFQDYVAAAEDVVGKEGEGFKIAMKTLDGGRIGIASQALGLGEGAVEEAIKYTKERVQFKKRLS
jgi:butyryl-CoA dehydrogenase